MNFIFISHYQHGTVNTFKASELASILKKESFLSGLTGRHMLKEISSPFTAEGVLRAIDLSGSTLNYKGYELLRSIEWLKKERHSKSILPSVKQLKSVATEVNTVAQDVIPFRTYIGENTDAIVFDYEKLLWNILCVHGLRDEISKRNVEVAISIDGANLSKRLSHMTAGIKLIDKYAKDPLTGNYLVNYSIDEFGGTTLEGGFQSRENCFPFLILIAKDSSTIYKNEHIVRFFNFFQQVKSSGIRGSIPLNISSPQDMSSIQKAVGKGGGSGSKTFLPLLFCEE